jgi:glyoxylase-like metal-dependent hydrolase (beta-lactamase superfamily II)
MKQIAPGVTWVSDTIVNLYLVGEPGGPWTLVDAGMPGRHERIRAAAEARYGAGAKPEAIILTHGHFDHYGSARELATYWDVPIYAHALEMPFLTGKSMQPPGDPTPGGFFAFAYRFLPPSGADLGDRVRPLPPDGEAPHMPGWRWRHTPGHTPGHISLFRDDDKTLLAGDAFLTVNLDSFLATVAKKQEIARPPTPATYDWVAARRSIAQLAELGPFTVAAGHGVPMAGPEVAGELQAFAEDFSAPLHGRYVVEPARTDENGIVSLPPPAPDPLPRNVAGVGVAALAFAAIMAAGSRRHRRTGQ